MKKILTIIIPTYNRYLYLKDNLNNLIPQCIKHLNEVDLFICDNASVDETEPYLNNLIHKYEFIRYQRHAQNLGPHANFYYGIENSNSEYSFLLGDDDMVSPHFVDIVLNIISIYHNNLGIIHFNYILGDRTFQKEKLFNSNFENKNFIKEYTDAKKFIIKYLTGPSFMSSVIFKKECLLNGKKTNYHKDCFGYDWLLCLYSGILEYRCIYYKFPIVVQRCGPVYKEWALNTILGQRRIFQYLDKYIPGIDDIWINKIAQQEFFNLIDLLMSIHDNRTFYRDYFKDLSNCLLLKRHRILLHISLFAPNCIYKFVFFISKYLNKIYLHLSQR